MPQDLDLPHTLLSLAHGVGLFAIVALVHGWMQSHAGPRLGLAGRITFGLILGGVAVLGMLTPVVVMPGVLIDNRSVIMVLAAPFGGPAAALTAASVAGLYRLWVGGVGTVPGLAAIVLSAAAGCAASLLLRRRGLPIRPSHLLALGLMAASATLLGFFLLPSREMALDVIAVVGLPLVVSVTFGTIFLGLLLLNEERRVRAEAKLEARAAELDAAWHEADWQRSVADRAERFRKALLDAVPIPVFWKDRELRYLGGNRAFREFHGRDDLTGLRAADVLPAEEAQFQEAADREVLATGITRAYEAATTDRSHGGEKRAMMLHKAPLNGLDGAVEGVIGVMMDVTDRVRSEEALRQERARLERQAAELARVAEERDRARRHAEQYRGRAEAANAAKSRFLAMMSHELRTPMTGILGLVDLLRTSPLTKEQVEVVGMLRRSADNLLTLLNDILDFSKIEAGELRLEAIPLDARQVLDEVVQFFGPAASQKGVVLEIEAPPAGEIRGVGDPTRLRQVLVNLVGNALKFTERGRIELRLSEPQEADGRRVLRFEVRDTGIGMSEDERARLFQPFAQADETVTRRFGGTGLGLAICRRLVEAMGGEIGVESAPGVGSLFWFTVSLRPAEAIQAASVAPEAAPAPSGPARGVRILLAEDNEINRTLISAMLGRMGHRVVAVENGREAVEAVRAGQSFDVVFMDMQMPVMDGVEATRRIRSLPGPAGRTPVVALTADAMMEHRARYMEAGLTAFLTKPIEWGQVAAVLGRLAPDVAAPGADAAPDADEAAPPVLDEARLAMLLDKLGPESLGPMVERLLGRIEPDVAAIREAVGRGDMAAARWVAHSLVGAVGTMGLGELCAEARRVETDAEREAGVPPGSADALQDAGRRATEALRRWRDRNVKAA